MRFFILNSTQTLQKKWPVSHLDINNGVIRLVVPNSGGKEVKIPIIKPERWASMPVQEDGKVKQKTVGYAKVNGVEAPVLVCEKISKQSNNPKDPRAIVYDLTEAYVDGYGPEDACIIWHYITKNMASGIVPMITVIPPYGNNKLGIRTLPGVEVKGAGIMTQFDKSGFNLKKAYENNWEHCPQGVFVMTMKPGSKWCFHGLNNKYASGFCEIWMYVVEESTGFSQRISYFRKLGANQSQNIVSYQSFIEWSDNMLKNPQMWIQDTREMQIKVDNYNEDPVPYNPLMMINTLNQRVVHRPPVF